MPERSLCARLLTLAAASALALGTGPADARLQECVRRVPRGDRSSHGKAL